MTRPQEFLVRDDRFKTCIKPTAHIDQLFEGSRWAEGTVYIPAMRCLIWSDIPNDRLLRWDETSGVTGVFRSPAGHPSNGSIGPEFLTSPLSPRPGRHAAIPQR